MKKLLTMILAVLFVFTFAACSSDSELKALREEIDSLKEELSALQDSKVPDFADCEIGYEMDVYPKVAFNYKLSDGSIIKIENISAKLVSKNTISKDDLIEGVWSPYAFEVSIRGSAPLSLAGESLFFQFRYNTTSITITTSVELTGLYAGATLSVQTLNATIRFASCKNLADL